MLDFDDALNRCRKEGGELATLERREQLQHVNRTDALNGTEDRP